MSRTIALTVTATLILVIFCCPPPALGEQQPEVKICPITQQKCETEANCDPPPPELLAAPAAAPVVVIPDAITLSAAPTLPPPHELRPAAISYWSAPTRTIVLRI